ncbi:MAG: putative phage abortive infection protein [Flavobacteriales bacterium]
MNKENDSVEEDSKELEAYEKKHRIILWSTIIIALGVVAFSFCAPFVFSRPAIYQDTVFSEQTGFIGDTIGGTMGPFIGLTAAILTFGAFYIQLMANRQQYQQFLRQFNTQAKQRKIDSFEQQFYEMLRLHKENVNELEITWDNDVKRGRKVFSYFKLEFEIAYKIALHFHKEKSEKGIHLEAIYKAYGIFFSGISKNEEIGDIYPFWQEIQTIQITLNKKNSLYFKLCSDLKKTYGITVTNLPKHIFNGRNEMLAHYYRHLFQLVKFVATQPDSLIEYEAKRKYLRILRALLSHDEQALLLYNWLSGYGTAWENADNKFLTDYRMIHNITPRYLIITDKDLLRIFNKNSIKKEKDREKDSLFEFEDW